MVEQCQKAVAVYMYYLAAQSTQLNEYSCVCDNVGGVVGQVHQL
jgi:hypothetical protein